MTTNALAIWGTSGHARVVTTLVRLTRSWDIVGYVDEVNQDRWGGEFCGLPVLGGRDVLGSLQRRGVRHLFLAFGANAERSSLARELEKSGFEFPTLVHPSAVVADDVALGAGVYVGPGAILNADAIVRSQTIINSGAIVEHEARVGHAVHIGPRACLAGAVTVGDCAWIGAGAVIRDKCEVGEHAMVGMGAVVARSVAPRTVVVGCPARPMRRAASS
ncbi:MAG TPA: acetyltransferase [Burkholderiaceae bacterium]|nr:acetyltransferase [Burkholderiaceae bacterium]